MSTRPLPACEPPALALSRVLVDVALALLWGSDHRAALRAGPAPPRSSLAGWVGQGSAPREATDHQVLGLWSVVASGESGVAAELRESFVDALLEHCAAGGGASNDDVDWPRARALAARLAALEPGPRAALRALGRRCSPRSTWEEAAIVVADELAPPALRAAWEHVAGPGRPGRPRRDPSQPPPDAERAAWGGDVLREALDAWARSETPAS